MTEELKKEIEKLDIVVEVMGGVVVDVYSDKTKEAIPYRLVDNDL